MSAIRLARGFTGRPKLIKFEGCYHGHADSLLVKAGSGLLTFGHPTSAGVPAEFVEHTLVLDYNDLAGVEAAFERLGDQIACVIVEPIAGNMNLVRPTPEFLPGLRRLCTQYGAVLIFDEVMTGFRVGPQGVQGLTGITPDLTTLAKIIGGGMPVGAFGGRADIMTCVAPLGPVYQAGTLSGNPVAVAAGLTTLARLAEDGFYERLARQTTRLADGLRQAGQAAGVTFSVDHVGGMFGMYFADTVPTDLTSAAAGDIEAFKVFFHACLEQGVYFAPSAFEAGFVSITHTDDVIDASIEVAAQALRRVAQR